MPITFSRTMRSIEKDDFRGSSRFLVLVIVLTLLWGVWFFIARITIYETTPDARLEVNQAAVAIEAEVEGRVTYSKLTLGARVVKGDVLIRLDGREKELLRKEAELEALHLTGQIEALEEVVKVREDGVNVAKEMVDLVALEGKSQNEASEIEKELAGQEAELMEKLHQGGNLSELERLRTTSEANRSQALAEATKLSNLRRSSEQKVQQTKELAEIAEYREEIEEKRGILAKALIRVERLNLELEKHEIRATISGTIAETMDLRVGTYLKENQSIGSILPDEDLKVVAHFPPEKALGRIQEGQPAQLRLYGFPWTQYGSISCMVTNVANESIDGTIRVLLSIAEKQHTPIPFQHGLTGSVKIELAKLSPAGVILQRSSQILDNTDSRLSEEKPLTISRRQ